MLLAVNEAVHLITADATESDCPPLPTTENVGTAGADKTRATQNSAQKTKPKKCSFLVSSWYLGPKKKRRTVASSDGEPLAISQNKRL
jgi:hypothetical protein